MSTPMSAKSAVPSTQWKETPAPGEEALHLKLAEALRQVQRARGKVHGPGGKAARALHAKANLGVEGRFEVLPNLPPYAAQGLFASPGKYAAYVRFSNGAGVAQPDKVPDVRGMAVKVLGVPGKKLIPGMEDATTQDFLAIRNRATGFRNAKEFVGFVVATRSQALALPRLVWALGPVRPFVLLKGVLAGLGGPQAPIPGASYYSAVPIQWGAYAACFELIPLDADGQAAVGREPAEALGEDLASRLRQGPVRWELRARLFVDEQQTPIENPTVAWESPAVPVARLTLPQQDVSSERGRRIASRIEQLSFDPWHAKVEHRPLGELMRARNHAYRLSTQERGAAPEPDASELA